MNLNTYYLGLFEMKTLIARTVIVACWDKWPLWCIGKNATECSDSPQEIYWQPTDDCLSTVVAPSCGCQNLIEQHSLTLTSQKQTRPVNILDWY